MCGLVASQTIHKSVFILPCGVCLAERSKDWWVKVPSSRKPPVDPLGTDSVLTLGLLGPGSAPLSWYQLCGPWSVSSALSPPKSNLGIVLVKPGAGSFLGPQNHHEEVVWSNYPLTTNFRQSVFHVYARKRCLLEGMPFGLGLEGMDFVQAEKDLREFKEEICKGPEVGKNRD